MSGSGKTRPPMSLTDTAIKAFKAEAEPYRVPDVRAKGLALRVAASGKTWDLRASESGAGASGGLPWVAMAILEPISRRRELVRTS